MERNQARNGRRSVVERCKRPCPWHKPGIIGPASECECASGASAIVAFKKQAAVACPVVGMMLAVKCDHDVFRHTVWTEFQVPAAGDSGRHEAERNDYPQQ